MEVKITHLDRVNFAIQSRSHTILCDQPAENRGEYSGMKLPRIAAHVVGLLRGFLFCVSTHCRCAGLEVHAGRFGRDSTNHVRATKSDTGSYELSCSQTQSARGPCLA